MKTRSTSVIDTSILCTLGYSYMLTFANSEDPYEILHNAVLQQGLHCFLDKNDLQGNICITRDHLIYTMDHPMFKVGWWLVGFVALRPKSTAMVIAGRSVHLTALFPVQA